MMYFADICKYLLAGEIIDGVRYPVLFDSLMNGENLQKINDYLEQMNYRCLPTEQNGGFYLVHIDSHNKDIKKMVKEQFEKFVKTIEPIVCFLQLCKNATDNHLLTGERIEFASILKFVDNSPIAKDELTHITQLLGRNSTGSKNELTSVLDFLEKDGYLFALNDDKTVFRATAKWELFYEQIRYIGECQNIIPIENTTTQGQLQW